MWSQDRLQSSGAHTTAPAIANTHDISHTLASIMPGLPKHVHFDDISSPASSSSSLPSSKGPLTPPPHSFGSPHPSVAPSGNAYIHPILSPNSPSLLDYDISLHPTSTNQYTTVSKSVWEQPATQPATSEMLVACDLLPWVLVIHPVGNPKGFVTVGDFVHGLYTALRQPVSSTEFSTLPIAGQTAVTNSYASRCKHVFDADQYDAELMKGVKRVDFLTKNTRFAGIRIGKGGRWNLMVSSLVRYLNEVYPDTHIPHLTTSYQ